MEESKQARVWAFMCVYAYVCLNRRYPHFLPCRSVKNWDGEAVNPQTNLSFPSGKAFEGLEAVNVNVSKLEKKKERSIFKRSGRSVSNNFNSFLRMNCLPAIAKSPCKASIYRRMSAILEMTFICINVVKCVCVSVWSWTHPLPCPVSVWMWRDTRKICS